MEFKSQRVHIFVDESAASLPSPFDRIISDPNGPLRSAVSALAHALLVRRVSGNITLQPPCTTIESGPNKGKCYAGTVRNDSYICQNYPFPLTTDLHLLGARESCVSETGPCSQEGLDGPGEPVDYILGIYAVEGIIMCCVIFYVLFTYRVLSFWNISQCSSLCVG